jgi:hypothetical protein
MSKLFEAFQRWKLRNSSSVSRTMPNPDTQIKVIPTGYNPIPDCRRCVHLAKNEMKLDEYEIHYGTCNITGQSISNMGYPWQCNDFYTANRDD